MSSFGCFPTLVPVNHQANRSGLGPGILSDCRRGGRRVATYV